MARQGRFALRVLALTAVSFGVMAPASFGQAVTLAGESFESVGVGQETTFGAYTCNKSGTTTIPFQTQGNAFGPYLGTFSESGTITIGPQTDFTIDMRGTGAVVGFQSTFTIQSVVPTGTVTGTKRLSPTAPSASSLAAFGLCHPDGSSPPNDVLALLEDPLLLYDAQINASTGSRTDSGTASIVMQSNPTVSAPASFQESFNSTQAQPPPEPQPCADDDDQHGHGRLAWLLRWKRHHGHNNDGDEDC
jgi:hypothetical protein